MYARALFEAAQEHDRLDQVQQELAEFVDAVRDVPELRALLRDPQLDPRAKIAALREILGDADELVRNFVVELSDDEAAQIVRQIEQSSGRTVDATRRVDPDLLGGVVLQVGSLRLDASLRGRLERLRREMREGTQSSTAGPPLNSTLRSTPTPAALGQSPAPPSATALRSDTEEEEKH